MFLSKVDKKKYPKVKQKFRFELQEIKSKNKKWMICENDWKN